MATNMTYHTSDGFQDSVVGENIVKKLFPSGTAPEIKTFSLYVKSDCKIKINGGKEVSVTSLLGANYSDSFKPVKSIEFTEDGIAYFIAYGV